MFERFTSDARSVVTNAVEIATQRHDAWIGTHHLLLAMMDRNDRLAAALTRHGITPAAIAAAAPAAPDGTIDDEALRSVGVDVDEIRRRTDDAFGPGSLDAARVAPATSRRRRRAGHLPFADDARQALESSLRLALDRRDRSITAAHLALGILTGAIGPGGRLLASRADGELRADLIAAITPPGEDGDDGRATHRVRTG